MTGVASNLFNLIIKHKGSRCSDGIRAGRSGFEYRQGKIFLFLTASRPAPGPTQAPIQWVSGAQYLGVKRLGREADDSSPSGAEIKNGGAIPPLRHMSSWHSA
jgi:hypothetical protein